MYMANHNIRCECGEKVSRLCIRKRIDGDDRPTSRLPFKGIGYYCQECQKIHSLDRIHESLSTLN